MVVQPPPLGQEEHNRHSRQMISGPCQCSFKVTKQLWEMEDPAPDRDQLPALESQSAPDRASVEIKNKAQMPPTLLPLSVSCQQL